MVIPWQVLLQYNPERRAMGYIYKITNIINNKIYIGQTKNSPKRRWIEHKRDYKEGVTYLYNAMKKHGIDNFKFEVIESDVPTEQLNDREIYWIKEFETFSDYGKGYNLTKGGGQNLEISETTREKHRNNVLNGVTGHTHLPRELVYTESVRKRMSESQKKRVYSEEELRKRRENTLKGEENPFYGKHHSQETKNKLSEIMKNRNETITEKCVNSLRNYYKTHEHCFKGKFGKDSARHKELYQYDENYNLINVFETKGEAMEFLGIKGHSNLNEAIQSRRLYKGYYWSEKAVETIETISLDIAKEKKEVE